MNKKLIVAAVAAAFAAPAAFAEVEVYGKANVQLGQYDNDSDDGSGLVMDRNNSNVGFRAADDLGNGMKGVLQFETSFDVDTGLIGTSGRDSFVGLEGDFGWVAMGRHNSPYKIATITYDVASDMVIDFQGIMGRSPDDNLHDDRISNAIRYKSKDMNGVNVDVLWAVKDNVANQGNPTGVAKTDMNTIALALNYKQGPFEFNGAYSSWGEQGVTVGATAEDDVAFKVGGKLFLMGNQAWISAIYEDMDSGGTNNDRTGYYIAGLIKMGQSSVGLGYALADDIGSVSDTGANMIQFQVKHNLSKATNVFAQYATLSLDKNARTDLYGLNFGKFPPSAADKSASYIGVGIQTEFSSK